MKKKALAIFALILSLTCLCACGSTKSDNGTWEDSKSISNMTSPMEMPDMDMPEAEANDESGYSSNSQSLGGLPSTAQADNSKLIYTAHMELETLEFDKASAALQDLTTHMGGYFENTSLDGYGTYRSVSYTVRVPSAKYDEFCEQAGEGCTTLFFSSSSDNVSSAYYDLEIRLKTQQTKLDRLQTLLSQAENMEDIIVIESAISQVEENIDLYSGSLKNYDSLVDYSTVYIDLNEAYTATIIDQPVTGFGAKLGVAITSGLKSFVLGLQNLIIGLAYHWVGVLIFLAVVAVVVVVVVRKRRRRKAALEAKTEEE